MSNKSELIDLLQRLHEYMDDRSDADGDSEGYRPNEEMSLMIEIDDMLYALDVEGHGSHARAAVDPNYKSGNFTMDDDQEESKYKLPGFDDTMDALNNLSIRKEEVNESIEKIKNNFKRFL